MYTFECDNEHSSQEKYGMKKINKSIEWFVEIFIIIINPMLVWKMKTKLWKNVKAYEKCMQFCQFSLIAGGTPYSWIKKNEVYIKVQRESDLFVYLVINDSLFYTTLLF